MTERRTSDCLKGILGSERRRPHGRYADSRKSEGTGTLGVSIEPRPWSGRWRWRPAGAR